MITHSLSLAPLQNVLRPLFPFLSVEHQEIYCMWFPLHAEFVRDYLGTNMAELLSFLSVISVHILKVTICKKSEDKTFFKTLFFFNFSYIEVLTYKTQRYLKYTLW